MKTSEHMDISEYWKKEDHKKRADILQAAHNSFLRTQGRRYAGIGIPAYPALSDALNGLRGSTLLTAPTGIGKTTLTLNIARSIAEASLGKPLSSQVHVVYITTEMPAVTLVQRLLSDMTGTGGSNCIYIRKLMTGDSALPSSTHETGKLRLGLKEQRQYEAATQQLAAVLHKTLHIVDKEDLDDMAWSAYKDGDHALLALQRLVDERTQGVQEVLVILDTIAHLDVEPSLSTNYAGEQVRQRYRDDLSRDEDITAALKKWRDHLGDSRALLSVHEESKARTGTGDIHAVRGSSRYAYGQDALLAMVYASTDKGDKGGGTVDIGIRDDNESDTTFQIDLLVNKTRDGGRAGVVIMLDHETLNARVREVPRDTRNPITAAVTSKQMRAKSKKKGKDK